MKVDVGAGYIGALVAVIVIGIGGNSSFRRELRIAQTLEGNSLAIVKQARELQTIPTELAGVSTELAKMSTYLRTVEQRNREVIQVIHFIITHIPEFRQQYETALWRESLEHRLSRLEHTLSSPVQ